ncbi:MAG: glycosyltransferase [Devosia sp.]|nr:glycosyltransferase [Devosia sp.]
MAYVEPQPHRLVQFEAIHRAILAGRPGHRLLNALKDGQPVTLSAREVNAALARANVGLILSAVEGSSYGSMEYMLAGLPVVSTPSVGGRDVYFDPEFCLVSQPDAASVRQAVVELKARAVPRDIVRMRTLEKIALARSRFLELVDELLGELGATPRLSGRDWPFLGWSGVTWAPYAAHVEKFVQAQRTGLAVSLGLDPRLLANVQLTAAELGAVVKAIRERPHCRLLVFGCGNDTPFWEQVNAGGETAFIEDDPRWAATARDALQTSTVYLVDYGTRLAEWRVLLDAPHRLLMAFPPEILERPWDVVLVDGPAGHEASSPGRMKSIYGAANLVGEGGVVFVHDSEREVEAAFAAKYLGDERMIARVRGRALLRGYRL